MGRLDLPNVCRKGGRLYYRRKVPGRDIYLRLPALDDPNFATAYPAASAPEAERSRPLAGTMAALVAEFRASAEFHTIGSQVTRTNYARYLDIIHQDHGREAVRAMSRSDVLRLRDRFADKPGKANN